MTIIFMGVLFPSVLLFFHTHNLFRNFFPGVTAIDICGFYIIGFITGVVGAFLTIRFCKRELY